MEPQRQEVSPLLPSAWIPHRGGARRHWMVGTLSRSAGSFIVFVIGRGTGLGLVGGFGVRLLIGVWLVGIGHQGF